MVFVLATVRLCFFLLLLSTLWWMRLKGLCKLSDRRGCGKNWILFWRAGPGSVSQSVSQSVQSLSHFRFCEPMSLGTPGLLVYHKLLEFTQTHAHRISDAIQPSHPLLSPSLLFLHPFPPRITVFSTSQLFSSGG